MALAAVVSILIVTTVLATGLIFLVGLSAEKEDSSKAKISARERQVDLEGDDDETEVLINPADMYTVPLAQLRATAAGAASSKGGGSKSTYKKQD